MITASADANLNRAARIDFPVAFVMHSPVTTNADQTYIKEAVLLKHP